jgi:hypothetical protein
MNGPEVTAESHIPGLDFSEYAFGMFIPLILLPNPEPGQPLRMNGSEIPIMLSDISRTGFLTTCLVTFGKW